MVLTLARASASLPMQGPSSGYCSRHSLSSMHCIVVMSEMVSRDPQFWHWYCDEYTIFGYLKIAHWWKYLWASIPTVSILLLCAAGCIFNFRNIVFHVNIRPPNFRSGNQPVLFVAHTVVPLTPFRSHGHGHGGVTPVILNFCHYCP